MKEHCLLTRMQYTENKPISNSGQLTINQITVKLLPAG